MLYSSFQTDLISPGREIFSFIYCDIRYLVFHHHSSIPSCGSSKTFPSWYYVLPHNVSFPLTHSVMSRTAYLIIDEKFRVIQDLLQDRPFRKHTVSMIEDDSVTRFIHAS